MQYCRAWNFTKDMNLDGLVTISDLWLWFKWMFFYPGDFLILQITRYLPDLSLFFEFSCEIYGGWFSGIASLVIYPFILFLTFIIFALASICLVKLICFSDMVENKSNDLFKRVSEFRASAKWKKRRILKSDNLEQMKAAWESQAFISEFHRIHHFTSNKFKTNPPDLLGFYKWCVSRDVGDENEQTIRRALTVSKLVAEGHDIEKSIKIAWDNHPLITR